MKPATTIWYALACVVIPVAWGLLMVRLTAFAEARWRARRDEEPPTIEYHI